MPLHASLCCFDAEYINVKNIKEVWCGSDERRLIYSVNLEWYGELALNVWE